MTIKKFISIENVGRLVNCKQKGPELNRYNLFFAENGRGKTTLCAVLRSLETGEHEHITGRKTLSPTAGDPEVAIRLDTGQVQYKSNAWNSTVPDIAIFDATFVAQNVHAGEYVSRDHRTNLLQVIIGQPGITLATQVNNLDAAIRVKNVAIDRARKAVNAHFPTGLTLDGFLKLKEDQEVDKKIASKDGELKTAKEADSIKKKALLSEVTVPALPEEFLALLAKTLDDVSADADKRLKEQIARHEMHQKGEAWLSDGLEYIKDDTCPFCGQSTKDLELVDAYKQYFSESYAALIGEIEKAATDLESALGEASIASLGRAIAKNEASTEFWKKHVPCEFSAPDHDGVVAKKTAALRDVVQALVKEKRAHPLEAFAADEEFNAAIADQQTVTDAIDAYNQDVKAANEAIKEKKKEAEEADVKAIETGLVLLGLTKKRYEPKVKLLCDDFITLTADKEKLDEDKKKAKAALDTHADKMIGNYETTINKLLQGFGAGFTITGSKKSYVGGTPVSEYQILINNQPVDLGDATTSVGEPCFKTTLSAGDKSTLALAFFLAKLDHDPNKADRIIVFDDPFNSQDRSRRERTAELLKKYGGECQQLILLSHDPFFLSLVHEKLPKAERHCLQLSRVPDNNTTIEEWDVKKETQEGYFKEHATLHSYLLNGATDLRNIARKIRPVLEGYLRYRFPNQFPDNEWLGGMIKYIRDQGNVHPMIDALEDLEGINDFSEKYHHKTNPVNADAEPIDDGELTTYVQRTLSIAGGY